MHCYNILKIRGKSHETHYICNLRLMGILGIGTDIVEIKRIKAIVANHSARFARRILSKVEWYHYNQNMHPVRFLAKRLAVKEAAAKAFGTGIRNGLSFAQFEVINDKLGKPVMILYSRAADLANVLGITTIHVTIADERHYACATVIFESQKH